MAANFKIFSTEDGLQEQAGNVVDSGPVINFTAAGCTIFGGLVAYPTHVIRPVFLWVLPKDKVDKSAKHPEKKGRVTISKKLAI